MRRLLSIVLALVIAMALAGIADGKPKKPENGFTTWNPKNYAPGMNGWDTRVLLSVNDVVDDGHRVRAIPEVVAICWRSG